MAALAMRSALLFSSKWLPATDFVARHGVWRLALIALPHIVALAIMGWSETTLTAMAAFLLTWGMLNFFWLALLRRPGLAGLLSLAMIDAARAAVTAQVQRRDDDGQFRRPDDDRHRYRYLPVHDLSRLEMDSRARRGRGDPGHGADLADRSLPHPAQVGGSPHCCPALACLRRWRRNSRWSRSRRLPAATTFPASRAPVSMRFPS